MSSNHAGHAAGDLRALLRHWRSVRGQSQLRVALQAGISQRHLSFIESGRSIPSRAMLLAIADALEIPLRERNASLLAAGYAPMYAERSWDDAEMRSVKSAVDRMLHKQEPYPGVLMDRYWNVLAANAAAPRFFEHFIDIHALQARTGRRNLLHLMFDPAGMRPFIHDWKTASRALIQRVHREATGQVRDAGTQELLEALAAYPDVSLEPNDALRDAAVNLPMIPVGFIHDDTVLNYFSMVTTVGTPQTTIAQELRVECLFPADELTEKNHLALMQRAL